MSVDRLQEKIRKSKNPSVFFIEALPQWLPSLYAKEGEAIAPALERYIRQLLEGLKDIVPAVRFGFGSFAMLGADGMSALSNNISFAKELGYYVVLDLPEIHSPAAACNAVESVKDYACDGFVVDCYLGSDVLQPVSALGKNGKAVFALCRTANKSASELQDLLTGGRLVHTAVADVISRYAQPMISKCGYSQLGAVAAASSSRSLSDLRAKFKNIFLLVDGYDYPNSNAKNCASAFDRLGHGAAVCASESIGAAWKDAAEGSDFLESAVQAALRMKKNLTRYITVL